MVLGHSEMATILKRHRLGVERARKRRNKLGSLILKRPAENVLAF